MMKRMILVGALAAMVGGCGSTQTRRGDGAGMQPGAAVGGETELTTYTSEPIAGDQAVVFVDGMACPMCATNVDLKLRALPGVSDARVNLELGSVVVEMSGPERPSSAELAKAVEDSGFTLSKIVVR